MVLLRFVSLMQLDKDRMMLLLEGELLIFPSRNMKKVICLLIMVMFSVPVSAEKRNMMVGVEENTAGFRTARRIVDAISERIGVKFVLISIPSGRANVLLEGGQGEYDGELIVLKVEK